MKDEQKIIEENIEPTQEKDTKPEYLPGTVTADEIENRKDKTFTIVGYGMRTMRSLDDESKSVEKLVLAITLNDGTPLDYFPNKTSQDTIRNQLGTRLLKAWVNEAFEWEVLKQQVAGTKRNVLFVKERD